MSSPPLPFASFSVSLHQHADIHLCRPGFRTASNLSRKIKPDELQISYDDDIHTFSMVATLYDRLCFHVAEMFALWLVILR